VSLTQGEIGARIRCRRARGNGVQNSNILPYSPGKRLSDVETETLFFRVRAYLCAKVQFSSSDVCAKVAFQNPPTNVPRKLLIPRVQNSRFSPITKS